MRKRAMVMVVAMALLAAMGSPVRAEGEASGRWSEASRQHKRLLRAEAERRHHENLLQWTALLMQPGEKDFISEDFGRFPIGHVAPCLPLGGGNRAEMCNDGGMLEIRACPEEFLATEETGSSGKCPYPVIEVIEGGEARYIDDLSPQIEIDFEVPIAGLNVLVTSDVPGAHQVIRAYNRKSEPTDRAGVVAINSDTAGTPTGPERDAAGNLIRWKWQSYVLAVLDDEILSAWLWARDLRTIGDTPTEGMTPFRVVALVAGGGR